MACKKTKKSIKTKPGVHRAIPIFIKNSSSLRFNHFEQYQITFHFLTSTNLQMAAMKSVEILIFRTTAVRYLSCSMGNGRRRRKKFFAQCPMRKSCSVWCHPSRREIHYSTVACLPKGNRCRQAISPSQGFWPADTIYQQDSAIIQRSNFSRQRKMNEKNLLTH